MALATVVVVGAECKRTNGAYCDDTRPCASGFACDLTARECHAIVGGGADLSGLSTDMAGCNCSNPSPICVAMTCVSCLSTSDPNGACAAASPSMPWCNSDGSCVNCRDSNDCSGATPFCDPNSHQCRGCIADSECPSLVCDLTSGSTPHACVPISQVEYVDCNPGVTKGTGLTPTSPRIQLQDGINSATKTDARPYVRFTGVCNEHVMVSGVTIYVVGADGATVRSTMNGMDAFGVLSNGQATVRNLIITATMGANGGNCSQGGVSFTAYHTQFINTPQTGVYSDACALTLDGCTVAGNVQGGVYIVKGDFTVKNTIIVKNMDTAFTQAATGANTVFVNNTVADNRAPGTAGVSCAAGSALQLINSILYNNRNAGNGLAETANCGSPAFMANDDVSAGPQSTVDLTMQPPGFVGGGDYHLVSTSPCLDHGTNTMGAPDHDADFNPRPDGTAKLWDIGAYELQK